MQITNMNNYTLPPIEDTDMVGVLDKQTLSQNMDISLQNIDCFSVDMLSPTSVDTDSFSEKCNFNDNIHSVSEKPSFSQESLKDLDPLKSLENISTNIAETQTESNERLGKSNFDNNILNVEMFKNTNISAPHKDVNLKISVDSVDNKDLSNIRKPNESLTAPDTSNNAKENKRPLNFNSMLDNLLTANSLVNDELSSNTAKQSDDIKKVEKIDDIKFLSVINKTGKKEEYQEYCNSLGTGFQCAKFKTISDNLDGIVPGLYLLGAEPNIGKSAFMMEMIQDLVTNNEDTIGLFLSLDDSKWDIIPRVISGMSGIETKYTAKPRLLEEILEQEFNLFADEALKKRKEYIDFYFSEENRFIVVDQEDVGHSLEEIEQYINEFSEFVKRVYDKKLVIGIDSIKDITTPLINGSNNEKHEELARRIKQLSKDASCPIFSSIHLKKMEGNRRPQMMDLKDSIVYQYEADVIWLLYNDVGKNNKAAKIYWNEENSSEKRPVLEVNWGKNKKSSYKGHSFLFFEPEKSRISAIENPDLLEQYNNFIYI